MRDHRFDFAGDLCFGKNIGELEFVGDPMQGVKGTFDAITDKMEVASDVASFLCRLGALGHCDGGSIIDA